MIKKEIDNILDYLKVIQTVYDGYGWDKERARPISIDTVSQTRIFLTDMVAQLGLDHIPKPDDVYPVASGDIAIDWFKIVGNKMDLFTIEVSRFGSIRFYSDLGTLGTTFEKTTTISEILDEMLVIHIKHFQ